MQRKPPRRTRERILETALALFNAAGEPHVTTADIADEMNISPGNLYYHFRNKADIIGDLYDAFEASMAPLLAGPSAGTADVEDFWLFIHVLFERMWAYRFFFRDLDEIASLDAALAARFAELVRQEQNALLALCGGMRAAAVLDATDAEIAALATNAVIVATYWMSYQRLQAAKDAADAAGMRFELGVSQVLALLTPYLHDAHRALAEALRARYLRDA
ncbi:MAG TPA: TetR/AcrR family transcriptional regulator [Casimicrobiaceae bacterium]|jgi:AcrR family transcriptional regulator|nr:TetR/AcrR family transcriptional regulator [Casimicrobiaceae bacterium]